MKDQFKIYKNMFRKAVDEGVGEFTSSELVVLDQMSGLDANTAIKHEKLPVDRIKGLAETAECSPSVVEKVVSDFVNWTRKLADQDLTKFGITATRIGDGVEELEYKEFD